MKKLLLAILPLLVIPGCATERYVRQQVEPVSCKVDVLESRQNALDQRVASMESRLNALESRAATMESQVNALPKAMELSPADRTMMSDSERRAAEAAQRAETAARAAEAAAAGADAASRRATKAFELGQKK